MALRKATPEQKANYLLQKPVYPLGYIATKVKDRDGKLHDVAVEDLRGSWSTPDPTWEIRAPQGYHIYAAMTHSDLCTSLQDVRDQLDGMMLERCTKGCGCGCEYDAGETPEEVTSL